MNPNQHMRCGSSALALLLVALASPLPLVAQGGAVVVPAAYDDREAPGAELYFLAPFAARRQLLIGADALQPAVGMPLAGLTVRRNMGNRDPQEGGRVSVELSLSHATLPPAGAIGTFAANRGPDARQVFVGVVDLPSVEGSEAAPAPWVEPFAVRLTFAAPFVYAGGTLCIESVTLPVSGAAEPWWPIDAAVEDLGGSVSIVGQSCLTALPGTPAGAVASSLALGGTATFYIRGVIRPGPVFCLVGVDDRNFQGLPLPLDLGSLGAPGCQLYNDVVLVKPVLAQSFPGTLQSHAGADLPIPLDPQFGGAALYTQWVCPGTTMARGPFPFGFSNGVRALLGSRQPTWNVAWVESPDPALDLGRVLRDRTPVLRLHW